MYQGFKHENILICGAGYSIKQYKYSLLNFIKDRQCATIGINFMTMLCIPDYHLWTNRKQLSKFSKSIDPSRSKLLFGQDLPKSLTQKYVPKWEVIYEDNSSYFDIKEDCIKGKFRTAGVLAIAIAHLMEPKNIWIAGMDGYTFRTEKDLRSNKASQHCYGVGYTDDADWKKCLKKDLSVEESLTGLKKYGVNFSIITPSVFVSHIDKTILLE